MKLRLTPLVIVAICIAACGLYFVFYGGNLGPPIGVLTILLAALCLLPNYLLRKIFKTTLVQQIVIELSLILVVCFGIYKFTGKIVLQPAHNFQGYVFVVYGVEKTPELPSPGLFEHNTNLPIPQNGIILTSDKSHTGYFGKVVLADYSHGDEELLEPGYGYPSAYDTIKCGNKKYVADVLVLGKLPIHWRYVNDTAQRNLVKAQICKLLK